VNASGREQNNEEARVPLSHLIKSRREISSTASDQNTENRFFTERRLAWYASVAALGCALIISQAGRHCLDFNWIWLTGKLSSSNAAAQVYNPSAALPPEVAALSQYQCAGTPGDGRFNYPPTVLFFTYLLGFMPYLTAKAVWIAATLLLYLTAVYMILPRAVAVIAALTTYPVALTILIGHNGFLTAGLFGLALAFMASRPWLSGLFLGLLTYKPQMGILFPLALLASRNWRAFVGASVGTLAFGAAAAIAFGYSLWPSFVLGMTEAAARLSDHNSAMPIIFPTVRGILRHMGASSQATWTIQAAVTAAIAAAIWALWSRPIAYSLKCAALAIASLLAAPYALSYDYCILSIAVAFIVKDGLASGFFRGERTIILLCWGGLSFFAFVGAIFLAAPSGVAGVGAHVLYFFLAGIPLIVCAALFFVVLRRAFRMQPSNFDPAYGLRPQVSSGVGG
jgi:arabinofuranan 3-O-arabinosyltransferase